VKNQKSKSEGQRIKTPRGTLPPLAFSFYLLPFAFCLLFMGGGQLLLAGESLLEAKAELDRLVGMSRINPEDELLKIRIRRYALEKSLPVPDLPVSEARDRFQRTLLKDNLAVVMATRAVEGTLQLDSMRRRIYQLQPQHIKISSLQPLEIKSHDYKALLAESSRKGAFRPLPEITRRVPEDKIYLSFRSFKSLHQFMTLWDTFAVPAINYLMTSVHLKDLRGLLESQLGVSEETFTGPPWDSVEEIALLFGDPYLHEGTDITLVIQFSRQDAVGTAWEALSKGKDLSEQGGLLESPTVKGFIKSVDRYLIISNNLQVAEKIQTGQGKKLAEAEDFLYLHSLNLPDKDGFLFLGEGVIRKLTGPEFKIKDLRRYACRWILADLQKALIFASTEKTSSEPVTLSKLVAGGYLPYAPLCPDKGEYRLDESRQGFACSVHGRLDSLNPLESLSIDMITQAEFAAYEQFKAQYQGYFTRFIDPIGVGIHLEDAALRLSTVVLPLIHDPLYTHILEYTRPTGARSAEGPMEEESRFFIFNNITPDYGISTALRSSLLNHILDRGRFWRSDYNYFHRKMLPYLEDNTVFGNELAVGIFDFKFPGKVPRTLKELAQAQIEVPLFLIQNLQDEGKAWEYLRALFQLASPESYKGTEIRRVNIAGHLNLYGSVVRKLFVLSTSSEAIQRIIDFPLAPPNRLPPLEGAAMPGVNLQTEINFDKIPQLQGYLFQLIKDQMGWSCKKNLVTLQNLLELSEGPKAGLSDSEMLRELLKFGGMERPLLCPDGGKYYLENAQVYCSVHNSLENYVELDEPPEKFFLHPLFEKLEKLLAQLKFTEDGIFSQVNLFLK